MWSDELVFSGRYLVGFPYEHSNIKRMRFLTLRITRIVVFTHARTHTYKHATGTKVMECVLKTFLPVPRTDADADGRIGGTTGFGIPFRIVT